MNLSSPWYLFLVIALPFSFQSASLQQTAQPASEATVSQQPAAAHLPSADIAPQPQTGAATMDSVKTVFVMPMKNRLEHFLTNQLVRWGRFEVTVNPHQADALLSDTTEVDIKELMSREPKIRKTQARTRGTAFLIDLKTEKVLWAVAKKPSESFFLGGDKSTPELAEEIIGQMRKDMEKPGK